MTNTHQKVLIPPRTLNLPPESPKNTKSNIIIVVVAVIVIIATFEFASFIIFTALDPHLYQETLKHINLDGLGGILQHATHVCKKKGGGQCYDNMKWRREANAQ